MLTCQRDVSRTITLDLKQHCSANIADIILGKGGDINL